MSENRLVRATFEGIVVSARQDKTITVLVETYKRHPKYGKRVKYRKKYYAHDEENVAQVGDVVEIMATRPISRMKRWRLVKVIALAEKTLEDLKEEVATEAAPAKEE